MATLPLLTTLSQTSTLLPLPSSQLLRTQGAAPYLQHTSGTQTHLKGHTDYITAITTSRDGEWIASAGKTERGWKAQILVQRADGKEGGGELMMHKVSVRSLAFSPTGKFLASLGGEDDGSIVLWDLKTNQPICGSTANRESSGQALCLVYSNNNDHAFITAGHETIRVWEVDIPNRKLKPTDVQTGQLKRVVKCMVVDKNDTFAYCGTTSGDVLQVHIGNKLFQRSGPSKDSDKFSQGVNVIKISECGRYLALGCGDGTVAHMRIENMEIIKKTKVQGAVTAICYVDSEESNDKIDNKPKKGITGPGGGGGAKPRKQGEVVAEGGDITVMVSTSLGNTYTIKMDDMKPKTVSTAHSSKVNDIAFPKDSSEIFATASETDVRIWTAETRKELLRILIPGLGCNVLAFKPDGAALLTGWTDGKIRAFGPETGRLQLEITDAHKDGAVTALALCSDAYKIVSGGEDGQVRIWSINAAGNAWNLDASLKEHKGTVSCIKIRSNNSQAISSSQDGSCIIWDLVRHVRNQVIFAPSFFKSVAYYPEESQVLTTGTDRKVGYWEAFDGTLIRELEASQSDSINSLDITSDGKYFVIGGSDKQVKVYLYEEGTLAFVGKGHSTDIQKVRITPDQKYIMSVSSEGAIFQWQFPETA